MGDAMAIRRLDPEDIDLMGRIDRSEHLTVKYTVEDGALVGRSTDVHVPTWSRQGSDERSVAAVIGYWRPVVPDGADLLGALDGDDVLGLAIVDGSFEPGPAWLAFLYVNRPDRRRGAASALWAAAVGVARNAGAAALYVSAAPSGSAVGFYLSRGCQLAEAPHPELFAREPEDIHLTCLLS
ncbi:MAG: GNAT family N-acetyltransferase [Acidimicrobiia bacterium]